MTLQDPTCSPVETFAGDATVPTQQKIDCLKLLNIVLKNLNDPVKSLDIKYRQLRMENEKIKTRLVAHAPAMSALESVGFVVAQQSTADDKEEPVLQISDASSIRRDQLEILLQQVVTSLETLSKPASKKQGGEEKLSEKQKARRMLAQKQDQERQDAKEQRKKNVALLKQDKYVRENDDNWSSGVCAAAGKSGTSISTFRDKYGE